MPKTVATVLPQLELANHDLKLTAQTVTEAALLGTYQFTHKTLKPAVDKIEEFTILEYDEAKTPIIGYCILEGTIIGQSVNLARDLGNHPAIYMTPTQLAIQAEKNWPRK